MVRGDVLLPERLGERPRDPLRHAPGVDEHERGAVRLDEGAEPQVDLGPDLAGHHRLERRFGQLQREVSFSGVAGVDDGASARLAVLAAGEEVGDGLDGALGRGQSDAGDGAPGERVQALEREREMRAPLVAGDGVDLVDDRGADAREHGASARAREQDVERLRRGHQDVRGLPAHGLARRAWGVAGAHHRPDPRSRLAGLDQRAVDAFEGYLQVLVHIVAERLERRDVEHASRVGERRPAAVAHQGVDGGEKAGQRLAGAGGRRNQGVAARRHRLPRLLLARGRGAEVRGEPGSDGGVETVEGHVAYSIVWRVTVSSRKMSGGPVICPNSSCRRSRRQTMARFISGEKLLMTRSGVVCEPDVFLKTVRGVVSGDPAFSQSFHEFPFRELRQRSGFAEGEQTFPIEVEGQLFGQSGFQSFCWELQQDRDIRRDFDPDGFHVDVSA